MQSGQIPGDAFGGGPYSWLWDVLPLSDRLEHRGLRHGLVVAVIGWVPLVVLAAVEGLAWSANPRESLLRDLSAYSHFLLASPLFAFAGPVSRPYLTGAVRQLVHAGIVAPAQMPTYLRLVESTRRLSASRWAEGIILLTVYVSAFTLSPLYPTGVSTWIAPTVDGETHLSLAGWWRALVAQPLFLGLGGVWLWRVVLWARFLAGITRLDLRLIASHPDRLGGLGFLVLPLRGFLVVAFAIGVIGAGNIAERVLIDGHSLVAYKYVLVAQLASVLILFAGPLLVLMRPLLALKARGILEYGRLASDLGRDFEQKWVARQESTSAQALGVPDFSATTDLFSIVANVRGINPYVVDLEVLMHLGIATLVPYVPVLLATLPFDQVLQLTFGVFT